MTAVVSTQLSVATMRGKPLYSTVVFPIGLSCGSHTLKFPLIRWSAMLPKRGSGVTLNAVNELTRSVYKEPLAERFVNVVETFLPPTRDMLVT